MEIIAKGGSACFALLPGPAINYVFLYLKDVNFVHYFSTAAKIFTKFVRLVRPKVTCKGGAAGMTMLVFVERVDILHIGLYYDV